jgi:cephalosporin-C deacetylase
MIIKSNQVRCLLAAILCFVTCAIPVSLRAAANATPFTVQTDRPDAIYKQGETVTFTVRATPEGRLAEDTHFSWRISKDGVEPVRTGSMVLSAAKAELKGQLFEPGFLLCQVTATVDGQAFTAMAGAAIDPLLIGPSMPVPDDFDAFWAGQRRRLAAVPMKTSLTPVTARNAAVECFDAQIDCAGGAPVSGYYARPRNAAEKSLPILLSLHGAGVRSASLEGAADWCAKGFLAMDINAHGIPNGQPAEFYKELELGNLKGYPQSGRESRDTIYFLDMFLRVFRAIDFLTAQPEWDGKTVVVYGSSQGAFQAFAAGLDERVSFIAAGVPAGCDHTGMIAGRASGWPKLVTTGSDGKPNETILQESRYFDNVNFAIRTRAKAAFVTVGFIDQTCPPSTVYAAYNSLPIPKDIFNDIPTGHANSPQATTARINAVMNYVKSVK